MAPNDQSKKRKRHAEAASTLAVDTSKPTAIYTPSGQGRSHTTSIALPGSIIANCQTHDQKTALAGQIARAAAVFCVDEIVVFNDGQSQKARRQAPNHGGGGGGGYRNYAAEDEASGYTGFSDPDDFLFHVLSYLETPPHLRRNLFPLHPNLRTAGALPSLDMPHHMKADEWLRYREGVTVPAYESRTPKRRAEATTKPHTVLVDCGLPNKVEIETDEPIEPNTRVTLDFGEASQPTAGHSGVLKARAVSPDAPREEAGYYWGYTCRSAASLSAVFTESTFAGGYDVCMGMSERGEQLSKLHSRYQTACEQIKENRWSHMLIAFGGVAGLEVAFDADPELAGRGLGGVEGLFDAWVNLVPGQGSRTIRTEEAVWIGLMGLRPAFSRGIPLSWWA